MYVRIYGQSASGHCPLIASKPKKLWPRKFKLANGDDALVRTGVHYKVQGFDREHEQTHEFLAKKWHVPCRHCAGVHHWRHPETSSILGTEHIYGHPQIVLVLLQSRCCHIIG